LNLYFVFCPPRIPKRNVKRIPPVFLPRPLLRAEYNSRGRANPKPQKNCFALPSPFFRILNQDFVGKKFGFCSGDTAKIYEVDFAARSSMLVAYCALDSKSRSRAPCSNTGSEARLESDCERRQAVNSTGIQVWKQLKPQVESARLGFEQAKGSGNG
jgi:hypothetical protein